MLALFDRQGLRALLEEDRGLIRAELLAAVDDEDEVLLVGDWASAEQYARWASGPFPGGLLDVAAELVVDEPADRLYRVVESVS